MKNKFNETGTDFGNIKSLTKSRTSESSELCSRKELIVTIKNKPVIDIYESLDGSYWFIIEKLYKQDSIINGKVYKDDQILFGYVRLAACPEYAEFGNISETELKLMAPKVWKVPKKNWHLCPEIEVKKIEDEQAENADQELSNSFQAGEKIKNFETKSLDGEQGIIKTEDNNSFWGKEQETKTGSGAWHVGTETQEGIRADYLFSDIYGVGHRGYQPGTRKAGRYRPELSRYLRNYQPLNFINLKPYRSLPKLYQRFYKVNRNQKYLYSGAKIQRMYSRQQGYESNKLERGWYRSLESCLNNCKGVAKNGMETYSIFD
jgi:hypothetical protein